MTLRRVEHHRPPGPQYCGEDGVEFSLPEGVDLVGIDNKSTLVRKQCSSSSHPSSTTTRVEKGPRWKSALKLILINVFVCGLVLSYALVGSVVFLALEGPPKGGSGPAVRASASGYPLKRTNLTQTLWNSLVTDEISQLKNETVRNIWDITLSMNILYQDNWTRLTGEEMVNFQRTFIEKIVAMVESSNSHDVQYAWTFPRAFLFAITTLTTIGYGGIGPKTSSAKIATMIYAIVGIPIMLWYLSNVGSLLAKIARFLCTQLCCCCCYDKRHSRYSKTTRQTGGDQYYPTNPAELEGTLNSKPNPTYTPPPRLSILVILLLSVTLLLAYISLGSYIVSRWEKWSFLDGFYFCFLTLTTISFGDVRGGAGSGRHGQSIGLDRFSTRTEWFCSFYILFGMALTSMFFNILHEEISRKYKLWKESPPGHSVPSDPAETLATVNRSSRRRPENSYSVHCGMNYTSPNTTGSRNFTEETIILSEGHSKPRGGLSGSESCQKIYDEQEVPTDYIVAHPIPPPREIYGAHPVFPR